MKKIIAGLGLILSTAIFACPNLEGIFVCTDAQSGQSQRMTIEQDGNVYTQITSEGEIQINADGAGRNFQVDVGGVTLNGLLTASCSASQLLIDINGRGNYQGTEFTFTEKSESSINAQGHLIQHAKGNSAGQEFETNTVCTRE